MFTGPGHSVHVNFRKETRPGLRAVAFPGSRVSPQTCRSAGPWGRIVFPYTILASLATKVGIQKSLPKLLYLSKNVRAGVTL